MKLYRQARKYGAQLAMSVVGTVLPVSVYAADAVEQALIDLGLKVGLYGAGLVIFSIIGVGFAIGIKYIKKAPRAA